MNAYEAAERHSGIMEPIAARLNLEEIQTAAAFYSRLPPHRDDAVPGNGNQAIADAIARGEEIARNGVPDRDVGACIACHRLDANEQNPNYPSLIGQHADYLVLQLELFQDRRRGGTRFADLMHTISNGLDRKQMCDVAAYYESLRP